MGAAEGRTGIVGERVLVGEGEGTGLEGSGVGRAEGCGVGPGEGISDGAAVCGDGASETDGASDGATEGSLDGGIDG